MTATGCATVGEPVSGIWISPIDGWGYHESIDGQLAAPFEILVEQVGVDIGDGIKGWRGHVLTQGHKYSGMPFVMSPRHTTWTETVVINVVNGDDYAFGGMAETKGLECEWL